MKCDIAIVGGGLAGASLAVALAPLGYDIKVIEAVAYKAAEQPSYDDRTLAISASSCRILKGLGVWPLMQENATAIREIRVRERNRPGRHPHPDLVAAVGRQCQCRALRAEIPSGCPVLST